MGSFGLIDGCARVYGARFTVVGMALAALFPGELVASERAVPTRSFVRNQWQLDFEFYDPQRITLREPGQAEATTYWYMLYRVTNNTGRDVQFYPSFRLVTDTLSVVGGGNDIAPGVYDAIAARHRREFPFFAPPTKVSGLLLQGRENARASAVVFRSFDPEADGFTIFVSGLSGVVDRIPNSGFDATRDETEDNPRFFVLRRTLAIKYALPGDPQSRSRARPVRRDREWVMR